MALAESGCVKVEFGEYELRYRGEETGKIPAEQSLFFANAKLSTKIQKDDE